MRSDGSARPLPVLAPLLLVAALAAAAGAALLEEARVPLAGFGLLMLRAGQAFAARWLRGRAAVAGIALLTI